MLDDMARSSWGTSQLSTGSIWVSSGVVVAAAIIGLYLQQRMPKDVTRPRNDDVEWTSCGGESPLVAKREVIAMVPMTRLTIKNIQEGVNQLVITSYAEIETESASSILIINKFSLFNDFFYVYNNN
jgi:hypothetical protein